MYPNILWKTTKHPRSKKVTTDIVDMALNKTINTAQISCTQLDTHPLKKLKILKTLKQSQN